MPVGGASLVGVMVMDSGEATAFAGNVTMAPSTVMVPPSGPIVLVTAADVAAAPDDDDPHAVSTDTNRRAPNPWIMARMVDVLPRLAAADGPHICFGVT